MADVAIYVIPDARSASEAKAYAHGLTAAKWRRVQGTVEVSSTVHSYDDMAAAYAAFVPAAVDPELPQAFTEIEVLDVLPTDFGQYPANALVYLATGNVIYRSTGTAWVVELRLTDPYGNSLITSAGFAGSLLAFIQRRVYNSDYAVGQIGALPVTEVNGANTPEDYAASLSPMIPNWVVKEVDTGATLERVADVDATAGYAVRFEATGAVDSAAWYQDAPVVPGIAWRPVFSAKAPTAPVGAATVYVFYTWLDADHAAIGARTSVFTYHFATMATTYTTLPGNADPADYTPPVGAHFVRLELVCITDNDAELWVNWVGLFGNQIVVSSDAGYYPASEIYFVGSGVTVTEVGSGILEAAIRPITKAGAPVDADFANPEDGDAVLDTTNHRWYVRSGGVWKYTQLT